MSYLKLRFDYYELSRVMFFHFLAYEVPNFNLQMYFTIGQDWLTLVGLFD